MFVHKSFQFGLRPTKKQARLLQEQLDECRWLYNALLFQRKLSKLEKGTKERRKQGKATAKIHERIKNQRKDFCHKESKKIVGQYQYICVEDLDIKNMIEGSYFAKSITDASWNQLRQFLTYKAAEAGRKLGLVSPAYTSQDCSQCGHREEKKLSDRTHRCARCGYTASRDLNAAQLENLNIENLKTFST